MRVRLFSILICAFILATGCSAGTPDSVVSEKIQSEAKKAETSKKTSKETAASKQEKAEEKKTEEKSADKAAKDSAASKQEKTEEKKTEEKSAEKSDKAAESTKQEKTEKESTDKSAKESSASEKKKTKEADAEKASKSEDKSESSEKKNTKEKDKKEESKKKEKDLKQESKEKYANDYIPDGFSPYGSYVLVYDSGYEVKTRLSKVGLTYYYESEEFLFTLDKNLPDMTREVAHILFNTAAPMDPANTGGEEFPFWEGFVIYINLDDGSYYEVPSYSLDLNGRIFARDIFETFRQKWEGAF